MIPRAKKKQISSLLFYLFFHFHMLIAKSSKPTEISLLTIPVQINKRFKQLPRRPNYKDKHNRVDECTHKVESMTQLVCERL